MQNRKFLHHLNKVIIGLLVLLLAACGGGGGSGDDSQSTETGTGNVAILFTDAPSDDFSQINLTVTEITLLGDQSQVVLFSGEQTFDLLALETFSEVFSLTGNVPVGRYGKIRLSISDLQLVKLDDEGQVSESVNPPLPANGKIDLVPQGAFNVSAEGTLVVEIDIDAKKIHQIS